MCSRKLTRDRWWPTTSSAALVNNRKSAAPNRSRKTNQISFSRWRWPLYFIEIGRDRRPRRQLGRRSFLRQLHCPLEFWRFFFDAEVVAVKFGDRCHIVGRERRTVWRFCEFNELFFVINVRQGRSDLIVREQP